MFDDFDTQIGCEEIYGPDYDVAFPLSWEDEEAPRGVNPDDPPFPDNLDMGPGASRELSDAFWAFFDRVYA